MAGFDENTGELRNRKIYVVCNDTLVENPKIVSFINRTLKLLQKSAAEQGMPITYGTSYHAEEELLREACADNPEHVELIHEMLTLQKNKTLLLRKRGLQQDLEKRLENFLAKRTADTVYA